MAIQHFQGVIHVALATALQVKELPSVTTMVVTMDKTVFGAQPALTTQAALPCATLAPLASGKMELGLRAMVVLRERPPTQPVQVVSAHV